MTALSGAALWVTMGRGGPHLDAALDGTSEHPLGDGRQRETEGPAPCQTRFLGLIRPQAPPPRGMYALLLPDEETK